MKIYRSLDDPALKSLPTPVMTVGVFDGFHRGHQRVFAELKDWASQLEGTSLVLTFDRHPRTVLNDAGDGQTFPYLSSLDHRLLLFRRFGIDAVLVLPFTTEFSHLSPREFLEEIMIEKCRAHHLLLGFDSRFGHRAKGDYELAQKLSEELDFEVRQANQIRLEEGEVISSSLLRELVKEGDLPRIGRCLNRPYSLYGPVVEGDKLGRKLGFPTANLEIDTPLVPPYGVYAVEGDLYPHPFEKTSSHWGLVNLGVRPTLSGRERRIEVHFPGLDKDLYNWHIEIHFARKIREEIRFSGPKELKEQIEKDCRQLQNLLAEDKLKSNLKMESKP